MADTHDITIDQGADFAEVVEWLDEDDAAVDMTGYSARMMVRATPDATGVPILSLTSDPGGGLTITAAEGKVAIAVDAATTAALTPGRYRYDLEIVSPAGKVTRLLEGFATVTPEVTRDDT